MMILHLLDISVTKRGGPFRNLEKFGLEGKETALENLVNSLPFGKLQKLEL
jgi:hypothetical protein